MRLLTFVFLLMLSVSSLACKQETKKTDTSQSSQQTSDFEKIFTSIPVKETPWVLDQVSSSGLTSFNQDLVKTLKLNQLPSAAEQFKYYPLGILEKTKNYISVLILQDYTEESYVWLINYSPSGELLDKLKVYYDNSEGSVWTNAKLEANNIVLNENTIAEEGEQSTLSLYHINEKGKFEKEL
ncbi:MAG: hypothetical protein KDK66_01255 [Deltaproteobacteria bacterium]|nr:hypothetical protein [Deltaproteobacteria bacterium]